MSFIKDTLYKIPASPKLIAYSKEHSLPGFNGVPIYDIGKYFMNDMKQESVTMMAKGTAFTFFLALFPALMFLLSVIAYLPIDNLQTNLSDILKEILPNATSSLLNGIIDDIVVRRRVDMLSLVFFLALFISSNGMMGIMSSFDRSQSFSTMFRERGGFAKRFTALKLTLVLLVLMLFSLALIVAGNKLIVFLLDSFHLLNAWNVFLFSFVKYIIILFLFLNSISIIYYYGPAMNKKWRFLTPGSLLATIISIGISIIFSVFVNRFVQTNTLYGSIWAVVALQIWIYLNTMALLIGFELNVSIEYHKGQRLLEAIEEKDTTEEEG
ncbi:YihY/virulence factor BrkB family protein [soil metagenome]